MQPQENNNTILKIITGFIAIGSILGAVFFYQKSQTNNTQKQDLTIFSEPDVQNTIPASTTVSTTTTITATATKSVTATKTAEIVNATKTAPVIVNTKYKNGVYTETKGYTSPGGQDEITISLTLKDDKIVDATFTAVASNKESREYQGAFSSGYKKAVIGKSVDSLELNAVSGASLTTGAFMKALDSIVLKAKA